MSIKKSDIKLLKNMMAIPDFFSYDLKGKGIKIKPDRFSAIYINMKVIWKYPDLLSSTTKKLVSLCRGCDCVIGIETGGSPYASYIAKDLKVSLILARKEAKEQVGVLAGYINGKENKFTVVDDVLATGKSAERGLLSLKNKNNKIRIVSILSYGMDELIAKKYDIEVISLYQIDDLLNSLDLNLRIKLIPYIKAYQEKLRRIINL